MTGRFSNFNFFGATHIPPPPPAEVGDAQIHHARRRIIQSIKTHLNREQTVSERLADFLVNWFGSISFLWFNAVVFSGWIVWNSSLVPDLAPFDPFPFVLLTMVVSLEAIFLSVFVLMSQNRESRVSELREEIDIQINMIAEQEITKIIHLVSSLMKHLNVPYEKDPELKRMMQPLNTEEIRQELERQLNTIHEKMEHTS